MAAGGEVPVAIAAPGNYVVTLEGPWGTRELALAVNPGAAAGGRRPGRPRRPGAAGPRRPHRPLALAAGGGAPRPDPRGALRLVARTGTQRLDPPADRGRPPGREPRPRRRRPLRPDRRLEAAADHARPRPLAQHRRRPRAKRRATGSPPTEGCGSDCRVVQFGGGAEFTGGGAGAAAAATRRAASKAAKANLQGGDGTGARADPARRPRRPAQRRPPDRGRTDRPRRRGARTRRHRRHRRPHRPARRRRRHPPAGAGARCTPATRSRSR